MTKTTVRAWISGLLLGSAVSWIGFSSTFSEGSIAEQRDLKDLMEITFDLTPQLHPEYDYDEVECLAKNIYFEARGETTAGQIAVAQVAMNRMKSGLFPDKICDVVYQGPVSSWTLVRGNKVIPILHECQFRWYCDGRSDVPRDMWAWGRAMTIASAVLKGEVDDNTHGAMWYHSDDVTPNWRQLTQVADIGSHVFYVSN